MKLGFIGLGTMGFPMAGHLQSAGHAVTVFNRTQSKAAAWVKQYGGQKADTPSACAKEQELVFTCVGNDDDLKAVTLGAKGAFENMSAGSIFIDHSTVSADLSKTLFKEAKQRGFDFLDAPVSGGQKGAENGALSIMLGGSINAFERAKPVLVAYGKTISLIGEAGSGQLCKMVNQICSAGLLQALSEAMYFGQTAGLDMNKVLEVISGGAAQSWQMDNRASTMLKNEYNFGFAVDWMRKDLSIVKQEAAKHELGLPVTELVDSYYKDVQNMGGGQWDTSALFERLIHFKNERIELENKE